MGCGLESVDTPGILSHMTMVRNSQHTRRENHCETRLFRPFLGPGDHFRQSYDGKSFKKK
jgi:hypothetical protein